VNPAAKNITRNVLARANMSSGAFRSLPGTIESTL
jgi:hypothetical protein